MKYRKKPIVIEAWQYLGQETKDWPTWLYEYRHNEEACSIMGGHLYISTMEGRMRADKGDYIIQGIKGELYPCKADIFEATYEIAESIIVESNIILTHSLTGDGK